MYKCNNCGNMERFVAEFRLYGECIVDINGFELEGIDSPASNQYVDIEVTTEIDEPHRCAECGSYDIEESTED